MENGSLPPRDSNNQLNLLEHMLFSSSMEVLQNESILSSLASHVSCLIQTHVDQVTNSELEPGQLLESVDGNSKGGFYSAARSSSTADKQHEQLATLQHSPRDYQLTALARIKQRNTIVSLGTGCGKTFIAVLAIKHFLETNENSTNSVGKNKCLLIVPSVALCIQQADTLIKNLPFSVEKVCSEINTENTADRVVNSDIVVATHGSFYELMSHYREKIDLSVYSLIVFDECHHADPSSKHIYNQILEQYHRLDENEKPRIVGLTASPIVSIKKADKVVIEDKIRKLEHHLDSDVFHASVSEQEIAEQIVQTCVNEPADFVKIEDFNVHKDRKRESKQIKQLFEEYGSFLTGEYIEVLKKEISRNTWEKESPMEFNQYLSYLQSCIHFCDENKRMNKVKTQKLIDLEKLLEKLLHQDFREPVMGIIFVERRITAIALNHYLKRSNNTLIKPEVLVRNVNQLFKYLYKKSIGEEERGRLLEEYKVEWTHHLEKIQTIFDHLRSGSSNILIGTSMVEEGIDVPSCSFVICLDGIKTIKAYLQMKGRARQQLARLYVFEHEGITSPLTLTEAQDIECQISKWLNERKAKSITRVSNKRKILPSFDGSEYQALQEGEYHTQLAFVNLSSSKSLLHQFCMSIPIDKRERSIKDMLFIYMPRFDGECMYLPSVVPPGCRKVELPEGYAKYSDSRKEALLSLVSIVRLHKLGLLNERLQPYKLHDLTDKLLKIALPELDDDLSRVWKVKPAISSRIFPIKCTVHILHQNGDLFTSYRDRMSSNWPRGRRMALLSTGGLESDLSEFELKISHKDLGEIDCSIAESSSIIMSKENWLICSRFYEILMNDRCLKRSSKVSLVFDCDCFNERHQTRHILVAIDEKDSLDTEFMIKVHSDYSRTIEERQQAVFSNSLPRIWEPVYSLNHYYIALDHEGDFCGQPFPNDKFESFSDYFQKKYSVSIDHNSKLYSSSVMWELTSSFEEHKDMESKPKLRKVLMPQDGCREAPLADPFLHLHNAIMPQILYRIDQNYIANSFKQHCKKHLPILSSFLSKMSLNVIIQVLTPKRCNTGNDYEKLEYIGDAVLKVINTDSLIHCGNLNSICSCLHEGYLTSLRSSMSCNQRLAQACKNFAIDKFIFLKRIERGNIIQNTIWLPAGTKAQLNTTEGHGESVSDAEASMKTCADVIEALLGAIYISFGYKEAMDVAIELKITIPLNALTKHSRSSQYHNQKLVQAAEQFLGCRLRDQELLAEAMNHPSSFHENLNNYQRLEWIGDAVLCLCVRKYLFEELSSLDVKDYVNIESALVSNEVFAFLCCSTESSLHKHILHNSISLSERIDKYSSRITTQSLWESSPPKALADVVESLIGSVHLCSGFEAGQAAARHILYNSFHLITSKIRNGSTETAIQSLMHPKYVLYSKLSNSTPLTLEIMNQGDFARRYPSLGLCCEKSTEVEQGKSDGKYHQVCVVKYHGKPIFAYGDSSYTLTTNRACLLLSALMNRNKDIIKGIQKLHVKVEEKVSKESI